MKNLLLALSLLVVALVAPWSAAARPPNVIIIFVDDMGYADIGPFGAKVATPNLDRMAREGRRFTNFHVSSAVCSASRAALLTGCYHSRVGIHGALGVVRMRRSRQRWPRQQACSLVTSVKRCRASTALVMRTLGAEARVASGRPSAVASAWSAATASTEMTSIGGRETLAAIERRARETTGRGASSKSEP